MFIEQSAARIRLARTLFVLLGVFPCAGLCGWAAVRHSSGHRDAIERRCEQAIGLPFVIGSIEHVRPNTMRLHDCQLSAATGGVVLAAAVIEVETLPHEVRVTLGRLDGTPALARVLADWAGEWLRRPVRFPVDCVVDIADFSWRPRPHVGADGAMSGSVPVAASRSNGLHIECVAANGSRAVRVRRHAEAGSATDEVRVLAGPAVSPADAQDTSQRDTFQQQDAHQQEVARPFERERDGRFEVSGSITEPLPLSVFAAACGLEGESLPLGGEAIISGTLSAVCEGGLSSGSGQVRIERIDLAAASLHLPHRVAGEACLAIDRLAWSRGRITACECACSVSRGRVGQRLLEACVSVLGCRAGPAYRTLAREDVRPFDDVSGLLRIDSAGVDLRAAAGRDGCLVKIQGLSILDEPPGLVPLDRLAWLLSPAGAPAVPASRATAWLLGWFALDADGGAAKPSHVSPVAPIRGQSAGNPPENADEQAVRPLQRSGF